MTKFDLTEWKDRNRMYVNELKKGDEAIDQVIAALQSSIRDMERYKGYLADHIEGRITVPMPSPESILSWVTGSLCNNLLGNCRIDSLMRIATEIAVAKKELNDATPTEAEVRM